MATILYVQQIKLPDEVRAEKICRSMVKAGHRVIVLSRWFEGMSEREEYQGYTVLRAGYNQPSGKFTPLPFNPFWRNAVRAAVKEFQPDCIIVREMILSDAAASAARWKDIPLLIDMAEHYPAAMRGWKKYQKSMSGRFITTTLRLPDIIEKSCVNAANGVIVVCAEQITRLQEQYGYPYEQMAIVHNTPELEQFRNIGKGTHESIVFAHHGYLQLQRNLDIFILGFALALREHPQIALHFAGEGETLDDLKDIVRQKHLGNSVRFTGEYRLTELASLYSTSDIGIIPYRPDDFHNHTLQNKLFDYMACGKPVLVSKAKPLARIMEETGAGISWDCSTPESVCKGIMTLLSSDITAMSRNGIHWANSKYNWHTDEQVLLNFVGKYC